MTAVDVFFEWSNCALSYLTYGLEHWMLCLVSSSMQHKRNKEDVILLSGSICVSFSALVRCMHVGAVSCAFMRGGLNLTPCFLFFIIFMCIQNLFVQYMLLDDRNVRTGTPPLHCVYTKLCGTQCMHVSCSWNHIIEQVVDRVYPNLVSLLCMGYD